MAEQTIASITLNGKDRTGVVAAVTQALFEEGGNIESLEEHVRRGQFHMALQASWPKQEVVDREAALRSRLLQIGEGVGMETRVRFTHPGARQRMAILVTREGHCLESLLEAHEAGRLPAEPAVVVGNRDILRPRAEVAGLPFVHIDFDDARHAEATLLETLDAHEVDFLVLARFMKILSPGFCWRWRNKILNIHPSLLPAFPGAAAYRQAWEKGVRVVGVTAHFVTPDLDQGPIIAQASFDVGPDDPLSTYVQRGQALEARVLLDAIDLYLSKRLDVHWGRVWTD